VSPEAERWDGFGKPYDAPHADLRIEALDDAPEFLLQWTVDLMIRKLFLVTASYYPDGIGGAERQAKILAEAIGKRGIDVTLIAPSIDRSAPKVEETAFGRIERFHTRAYPNSGGRYLDAFVHWGLWFWKRYRRRITPETPVYVFHARLHAFAPILTARAAGAVTAIKLGGGGEASDFAALRAKRYFYGTWVQSYLVKKGGAFVANSLQIEQDLQNLGVDRSRIAAFPNGVVVAAGKQARPAPSPGQRCVFVFAGRLVRDKRLEVLYEAAKKLIEAGRPVQLMFLGSGSEGDRLQRLARRDGLGSHIQFPGFHEDVYPILAQADFYVSASVREGQSNALLEAMSAGLIPIVYGASGATDVIHHGKTGFLVGASDTTNFLRAMEAALALPDGRKRAMSDAAHHYAEHHIGIDAIARQTIEVFETLLQNAGRPEGSDLIPLEGSAHA
jgi:glycosyltransferase involved in cell wall biosynthesis